MNMTDALLEAGSKFDGHVTNGSHAAIIKVIDEYKPFTARTSAAVLLRNDEHVLLVQRNKEPRIGQWVLPGGKLEKFERFQQAAVREVKEETGLSVTVLPQPFYVGQVITPATQEHRIVLYFKGALLSDPTYIKAGDDAGAAKWVHIEDLWRYDLTPATQEALTYAGLYS